jgi:WD repeat-containing protein 35
MGGGAGVDSSVIASERPRKFAELAVRIFTQNPPVDHGTEKVRCRECGANSRDHASACGGCGRAFAVCVATGKAMMPMTGWSCRVCRHRCAESEIAKRKNCPLCHTPV